MSGIGEDPCVCRAAGDPAAYMHDDNCPGRHTALARFYAAGARRYLDHAAAVIVCAADLEMAAKGHVFRARELRYDANGGHVPPGGMAERVTEST